MVTQHESKQAENILADKVPDMHGWLLAQILDLKNDILESGKCLGYIKLEDGKMAEVFISTKRIPEYMTTETEIKEALTAATDALLDAKKRLDKQAAQIERLTSERDIFSVDAEHWRTLAYKLAQPRELQPPVAPLPTK